MLGSRESAMLCHIKISRARKISLNIRKQQSTDCKIARLMRIKLGQFHGNSRAPNLLHSHHFLNSADCCSFATALQYVAAMLQQNLWFCERMSNEFSCKRCGNVWNEIIFLFGAFSSKCALHFFLLLFVESNYFMRLKGESEKERIAIFSIVQFSVALFSVRKIRNFYTRS